MSATVFVKFALNPKVSIVADKLELITPLIKSVQELKKENSTLKNNINNIKENYIELILPLVKSVQELKDENTVLKNKFNYYIKNNTI